ncbi:amine oxidase (flavin-containing) [Aeromicrobium marinum DSM 15272]|uniref:Amine oxidase (Flavin-containing) n=1 Tax=Aeromicrobium marinum DSM 15272 TaxID=585531 RepID=E2SDJ9_9ACTN|nr:NAD(P)/FAD-dependent oxidoreductase [Aeromicrobium marinum]EFQ82576.1 amine oxidase (flavin-containing) [Aeromicrobium marinum DSM 15272]
MTPGHGVDVVVVGAGVSGLVAARDLRRAGFDVVVLESADRCGGRTLTRTSVLGSRLDLGGQWIGHDHHRLAALCDELGATRYRMQSPRIPVVLNGPDRVRPWSPTVLLALALFVVLEGVRRARRPQRWAAVSIDDWLSRVPGRARRLLEVAGHIAWTTDLRRVSVTAMVHMIRTQHGVVDMLTSRGGAQDGLIVEGTGHLVDHLVAELGAAVRTGTAVTAIVRDPAGVTVRTTSGEFRAQAVVVAVPPPTAARIAHEPPLPEPRGRLEQGTAMGAVYKAIAIYPTPFWRTTAAAETVHLDRPGCGVFDTSAPDGPGHLCFLVGGPDARRLDELAPAERRRLLLGRLAERLGSGVLDPVEWHEKAWHLDPDAGGGYVALPMLGAGVDVLPMPAEPLGRVHWAGTETARDHPGYIDGAIESGERAAAEVVAVLARPAGATDPA